MDEEQVIEPKKNKGGRPKGSVKKPEGGFSKEEVKDFLTAAISEMKKPTDIEQAKIDEKKSRREKLARASAESAKREAQEIRGRIALCQHRREDEKHTFHAHICSDGYIRGGCLRCEFEFGPVTATQAQRDAGAVNLHLITELTAAQLTAWTEDTLRKHPEISRQQPAWAVA